MSIDWFEILTRSAQGNIKKGIKNVIYIGTKRITTYYHCCSNSCCIPNGTIRQRFSTVYNDRMFLFVGAHTSTSRIGIVGAEKDNPSFWILRYIYNVTSSLPVDTTNMHSVNTIFITEELLTTVHWGIKNRILMLRSKTTSKNSNRAQSRRKNKVSRQPSCYTSHPIDNSYSKNIRTPLVVPFRFFCYIVTQLQRNTNLTSSEVRLRRSQATMTIQRVVALLLHTRVPSLCWLI